MTMSIFKKDENATQRNSNPPTKLKRWTDTDNNPCKVEAETSYQCLHDNNFDRRVCEVAFANYRNCQKFWNKIQRDRRRQGIYPALPSEEERQEILREMQSNSETGSS